MNLSALSQFFEEGIPFNRALGIKIDAIEDTYCVTRVPFKPELIGNPTIPAIHGGVLSTLADTAGGLAVLTSLKLLAGVSTIDLRIDYLRPAGPADLFCRAESIRVGNRVGVTKMRIYLGDGDGDVTIAECRGVYNIRRPDRAPKSNPS